MVKNEAEFWVKVVQIIILAIILGLFIARRVRLKIKAMDWFIWVFIFAVVQAIYEAVFYLLRNVHTFFVEYRDTHYIIYGVSLLILFFFLEVLEHNKPRFWTSTIVVSLFSLFVCTFLYELVAVYELGIITKNNLEEYIGIYFFDIFQIVVMLQATVVFIRIFRKAEIKLLKNISMFFVIFFVSLEIVSILELIEHWVDVDIPNVYFFTAAFLYVAIIFIIFPYYVYLVPYSIYNLMLINNHGLLIYNCKLGEDPKTSDGALLMGGAISGLESFLRSIFDTEERLEYVRMKNRTLTMVIYENMIVFAIVERSSYILRNAMMQFIQETLNKYPDLSKEQSRVIFNKERNEEISKIIARVFPFIQSDDVFPVKVEVEEEPTF
ncbi:MAG: hypothetical protein FK733_15775 [Asgard group archaeon]|nr:hypothetical protein [Asgard group archaeon]